MGRSILAVIAGIIAGGTANFVLIALSWVLYPLPDGVNLSDPATMKTYTESLPVSAFLLIVVAHASGALVGGFLAALLGRGSPVVLGTIMGVFFLLGGVANVVQLPCPLWFAVVDLVSYVPCGILGAKLAPRRING
ncbi:MAG: hypothetical protein NZ700_10945 [Gemmataceae bacterium]|nr:hypothetical protein [Gemmataceae bacterium]MDW8264969.1 hypothetical protein [Gemmataceae bacterium]